MRQRKNQRTAYALWATLALLLAAEAARADQVTSKGTVLHGKITGVGSAGITFEPEYGKGSITIKWQDIEDLSTDGNFQVLYGDEETDTPLQGFSDGKLLTGSTRESATAIDVSTIVTGFPIGPEGPGWIDRTRSTWRYWDGSFDLGFNLQRATINTKGLTIAFKTTRKKDGNRLLLGATYRYATTEEKQTVQNPNPPPATIKQDVTTTTQDQWYGIVRDEQDVWFPRFYLFGSGEATYDAIQRLSIRGIPKAGVGYTFFEEQLDEDRRNFFSGEVGGAWVYERFFGGSHDDFFAIAFGALAGYYLPYGAHLDGIASFLPAVDDFTGNYLASGELDLTMPIYGPIGAKFSVVDVYDSTPAPDTKNNSLYITFGLSLLW